ncbi:Obtusifoliol 14-alpha demethylase (CYPLI) (Cytochrome P450 51) (Cytochrome P450-LIA1) [Durusdinium trenchii]|uniref:Obtusifoliol 14-alpha demethylase (CYPLI) (Cytochrome P450 51) (Cytochrome P450-LIA1) n=1 Tax=Durusdinium trenchii TaxID=1381693 RepID=A0ABP0IP98_9DINO
MEEEAAAGAEDHRHRDGVRVVGAEVGAEEEQEKGDEEVERVAQRAAEDVRGVVVSGAALWKGVGDTAAFAKDPERFLSKRFAEKGEVFGTRILQWPVVFAASHRAVSDALGLRDEMSAKAGYSAFSGLSLFGPAVLFQDGDEHGKLRKAILQSDFASYDKLKASGLHARVARLAREEMAKVKAQGNGSQVRFNVYDLTKQLCAAMLCLCFLPADATAQDFTKLQAKFWRGTASSGLNFSVSLGFGVKKKSAFNEAKEAREELRKLFQNADQNHESKGTCPFGRKLAEDERIDHLLMFTSSMVVKAIGSVVCSFVVLMDKHPDIRANLVQELLRQEEAQTPNEAPKVGGHDLLFRVLLETERLFPPVIGCCRSVKAKKGAHVQLCNKFDIPDNTRVWCSFITANRDPAVYKNPLVFDPSRWQGAETTNHFSFGAFQHECLGKPFARSVIRETCIAMLLAFPSWKVETSGANRWLPVTPWGHGVCEGVHGPSWAAAHAPGQRRTATPPALGDEMTDIEPANPRDSGDEEVVVKGETKETLEMWNECLEIGGKTVYCYMNSFHTTWDALTLGIATFVFQIYCFTLFGVEFIKCQFGDPEDCTLPLGGLIEINLNSTDTQAVQLGENTDATIPGILVGLVLLFVFTLPDAITGLVFLRNGYIIIGVVHLVISLVAMLSSATYVVAVSTSDVTLLTNVVVLVFLLELDEKVYHVHHELRRALGLQHQAHVPPICPLGRGAAVGGEEEVMIRSLRQVLGLRRSKDKLVAKAKAIRERKAVDDAQDDHAGSSSGASQQASKPTGSNDPAQRKKPDEATPLMAPPNGSRREGIETQLFREAKVNDLIELIEFDDEEEKHARKENIRNILDVVLQIEQTRLVVGKLKAGLDGVAPSTTPREIEEQVATQVDHDKMVRTAATFAKFEQSMFRKSRRAQQEGAEHDAYERGINAKLSNLQASLAKEQEHKDAMLRELLHQKALAPDVLDSMLQDNQDRPLREKMLLSIFAAVDEIERVRLAIRTLKTGQIPSRDAQAFKQNRDVQSRIAELRRRIFKFEKSVYERTHAAGLGQYKVSMESKLEAFEGTLQRERKRRVILLEETRWRVDHANLQRALEQHKTISRMKFLQLIIRAQARFRANRVQREFKLQKEAAKQIQLLVRHRQDSNAAISIQKVQRQNSAQKLFIRKKQAITTIQRLWVRKVHERKLRKNLRHEMLSADLKTRAAIRLFMSRRLGSTFTAWIEFCSMRKHVRRVLLTTVEKWSLQRTAFAFKLWWVSTRHSYRVDHIARAKVVARDAGAAMPCVRLFRGHFLRESRVEPDVVAPLLKRADWTRMVLVNPAKAAVQLEERRTERAHQKASKLACEMRGRTNQRDNHRQR